MDKREELEERLSIMEGNVTSSAERVREAQDLVIAQQAIAEIWLKNVTELRRQLAELDEPTEWVADAEKPFEFINSFNEVEPSTVISPSVNRDFLVDLGNAYEPNIGNAQAVADARQAMVNIRRAVGERFADQPDADKPNNYYAMLDTLGIWSWHRFKGVIPNGIFLGFVGHIARAILDDHADDFAKIKNCIDRGLNII